MTGIGKYIRRIIAGLIGALAAWAAQRFGIEFGAELQAALVVVIYAIVQQLLTRFRWLDPEAWAEREWAQGAAEQTKHASKNVAADKIRSGEV